MSHPPPARPLTATAEQAEQAFHLIVDQQADPSTACSYLGTGREGLEAELADLDVPWPGSLRVGVDGGRVVAAVLVEHDEETGRSWVHGPWAADDEAWARWAEPLLDAAVAQTPEGVDDHELCAAPAHLRMAALAASRGWPAGEVNITYVTSGPVRAPRAGLATGVRHATPGDLPSLGPLHDGAFPGTYATARQLLDDPDRITVVLERGTQTVGYASAEIQADGNGYLDFVAVTPSLHGRGLGRLLVEHVVGEVLARPGTEVLRLTVGASNAPALALYASLGLVRDSELVGYRSTG